MKTNLLAITIGTLVGLGLVFAAEPAECEGCIMTGYVCYGTCLGDCICIQPNGPGTEGWCN